MLEKITNPGDVLISEVHALYNRVFPKFAATKDGFCKHLALDHSAVLFTWRQDGVLAGFAVVSADGLLMLAVDEAYRRRGIGSSLLSACEREATPYGKLILGHGSSGPYLFCGAPLSEETDAAQKQE